MHARTPTRVHPCMHTHIHTCMHTYHTIPYRIQAIDHPVCYFSKKFNKQQLNCSTIEKEALALLLALQHFEVYLGSQPIQVFTDHNPLVFLSHMRNSNQRLMRWSLLLQDFNVQIFHRKGTDNVIADALSRCSIVL